MSGWVGIPKSAMEGIWHYVVTIPLQKSEFIVKKGTFYLKKSILKGFIYTFASISSVKICHSLTSIAFMCIF